MISRWLGFESNESIGTVLARHRGIGPGFDILRLLLAFAIFCGHAKWTSGGGWGLELLQVAQEAVPTLEGGTQKVAWVGPLRPIKLALVPMFFALSGFLVMASAMRVRATSTFLAHRGLRIFPALAVEVLLSAFLLGPLLTEVSLSQYFSSVHTWQYLGNIVGHITYVLPGLFLDNPVPQVVNGSLWTLPSEFYCYLILAACMLTRIAYNRNLYTWLLAAGLAFLAVRHFLTGASAPDDGPYPLHVIVVYFLLGVLAQHWKDRLPANFAAFVAAVMLSYVLMMFDATTFLVPFPLIYATIFFGLLPLPKFAALGGGDYSYGIYLYGFPITQALLALWPDVFEGQPMLLIPAALAVTVLFAVFSWHFIERHALGMKRRLPTRYFPTTKPSDQFEQERLATAGAIPAQASQRPGTNASGTDPR